MSQITAQLMQLPHGKDLPLPSYETAEAAGMDLRAAVPEDAPLTLKPGARELVPTGFAMAIPPVLRRKSGRARGWRSSTASASSMRRARLTATIAVRSKLFLSISVAKILKFRAACALPR